MSHLFCKAPVLGIETSCDETAAAVFHDGKLLSNVVARHRDHERFGGVVPEIASRAHAVLLRPTVEQALGDADLTWNDLGGIGATHAPGLIGSLLVGLTFAKSAAVSLDLPFIGVNHLEAHLVSVLLSHPQTTPPLVALLVSGGHTEIVQVDKWHHYRILGTTRDDAAGEAFDKVSVLLGETYPGGPCIDRLSRSGNPKAFKFPRAWLERDSLDFSFSGLKTAVRLEVAKHQSLDSQKKADLAASFQEAVVEVLSKKLAIAARGVGVKTVVVAGGVAANDSLRNTLEKMAQDCGWTLIAPALEVCGDNGGMVALAASMRLARGEQSGWDLPALPTLKQSGFSTT